EEEVRNPIAVLVIIILSLTVFFILFTFTSKAGQITQIYSSQQCRASFEIAEKTKVDLFDIESPLPLECSTRYATAMYGNPKQSKDLKTNFPVYYVETSSDLKKVFAEEIGECFWKTGEGQIDPFGGDSKERCILCSEITLDEELVKEFNKKGITTLAQFDQFMYQERFARTKRPYAELFPGRGWQDIQIIGNGQAIPYTIFWHAFKPSKWDQAKGAFAMVTATGCAAGGVVGAVPGAIVGCSVGAVGGTITGAVVFFKDRELQQGVFVAPFNQISAKCEQMF
ncbi:hypothetical protein KY311_04730, partial [Candidatus Woesearchaeota archaeon]|nr:hypothetical protein [Candidatus Woesearchaeota archaeon]